MELASVPALATVTPRLTASTGAKTEAGGAKTEAGPLINLLVLAFIVSSTVNTTPLPGIIAVSLLAVATILRYISGVKIDAMAGLIFANYGYWIVSALLVGFVPATMFLDYDFWRWDGRIFFSYVPLLFFLTCRFSPNQARLFLTVLLVVCAVLATGGLVQIFAGSTLGFPLKLSSSSQDLLIFKGLMDSHNATGAFYGMVSLTWLILLTSTRRSQHVTPNRLMLALLAVTLAGFILAISRAGYVGFAAGLAFYLVWLMRHGHASRLLAALMVVTVAVGTLVFLVPSITERLSRTSLDEGNVAGRIERWDTTLDLIPQSPLLGLGFSRWNDLIEVNPHERTIVGISGVVSSAADYPVMSNGNHAHNTYLAMSVETGLIGLLLLLALFRLISQRLTLTRTYPSDTDDFTARLGLAAKALFPFLFANALFGHAFAAPAAMLPFTIVVGLALATSGSPQVFEKRPERRSVRGFRAGLSPT